MAECKFCENLTNYKKIDNFFRKREKEPFKYEYTVALVIKQWLPSKGKRRAGRTTDYRYQGLGYKLNYCPECGKKLKGR